MAIFRRPRSAANESRLASARNLVHPDLLRRRAFQVRPREEPAREHLRLRHEEGHVGEIAALDPPAAGAGAARPRRRVLRLAVRGLGEGPRQELLADALGAREQIRVVDVVPRQRTFQQAHRAILTLDLFPAH